MIGIQDAATADPPSGKFVPTKEYESHLEKQGKSWLKKLRLTKDPALRGRVVAIEPDHGRYVVADTFADAIEKFRENFGPNAPHAYYTRLNK